MLSSITRFWRPTLWFSAHHAHEFLASRSAFISQKCTVEYCRARAGLNWDKLFRETAFTDALEHCRWESFAAVLGDVTVLMEGKLRPHLGGRPRAALLEAMVGLAADVLDAHPAPVHRDDGWSGVLAEIRERLSMAQLVAPKPAREIGYVSAKRVFDVLPIHTNLRRHDFELVQNNIRFNLCRAAEDFERRADARAMVTALLQRSRPAA